MARRDAVEAVTGRLFEDGWGRIGRGRALANVRHMARAAQGASPAFFKLIRTGGCASRGQLGAQFSYLFSKSVDVHDSRGLLDGEKRLTPEQIDRAVARWADDWRGQMNAARTTHMVMSFPRETKPRHVSLIAGEICREKLGGRFDYMIAVHTDSPNKNPHAHIIVNRRGEGGDYFTLRKGTEFTYQAFKEAMVDHAARYGIQLEATTRLQRGHVNYPPTDGEWRRAKEKAATSGTAFEAPEGKPRIGSDLARATQEVRDWSLRYRDLSSFASATNLQDLATAFEKAAAVLAQGGSIDAKGEPYMAISEDFDRAAAGLRRAVDDAEDRIADAAPNQRPEMERKLAEALTSVEHLQPLGARSRDLRETASEQGIYSAQNLRDVNARFVSEGRDKLTAALDGTGIDPVEVEARMRVGANSAALEARWVQQDLQAVADLRGLDLRNEAQLRQAIDVVDRAYDRVAEGYGVDDAIAARARTSGTDAVADYDQRFPRRDTRMADEGSAEQRRDYDREMAQMEARQLREAAERGEGLPDERPMTQEAYRDFMRDQMRIAGELEPQQGSSHGDGHAADDDRRDQGQATRYFVSLSRTGEVQEFLTAREAGAAFAEADARNLPMVTESDGASARKIAGTVGNGEDRIKSVPSLEAVMSDPAGQTSEREFWAGYHERARHQQVQSSERSSVAMEDGDGAVQRPALAIDAEARDRRDQGAALERMERGHDQGPDTGAQLDRARRDDADAHQPTASIGSTEASRSALREFARPVGDEDERKLREAIERALTRDELDRLKRGDAEVLRGVGDREDQLTMARDYLRGLDAPGTDQALQRVNEALAAERDHVRQQRGHEGPGHD